MWLWEAVSHVCLCRHIDWKSHRVLITTSFEIRKRESSKVTVRFQDCAVYSGSLAMSSEPEISLAISETMMVVALTGFALNL